MTLLDLPISGSSAERRAAANFLANCSALAQTQPEFAQSVLPPRQQVEWVFGRDGFLTAIDEQGDWWSSCSLPVAAGMAMLDKMDVHAPVACFLAPPHAAQIRIVLDKFEPEQAIIAVVPEESDVRLILSCDDFSKDIIAHRLWIAAGTNWAAILESILAKQPGLAVPAQFVRLHSTVPRDGSILWAAGQCRLAVAVALTELLVRVFSLSVSMSCSDRGFKKFRPFCRNPLWRWRHQHHQSERPFQPRPEGPWPRLVGDEPARPALAEARRRLFTH